jgi:hypothetical protein
VKVSPLFHSLQKGEPVEKLWSPPTINEHADLKKLRKVVKELPTHVIEAFYAASLTTEFESRTWQGCVFNASAESLGGKQIDTIDRAASFFQMLEKDVAWFIHVWDSLDRGSKKQNNKFLQIVLNDELERRRNKGTITRTYAITIHESSNTIEEEFKTLVEEFRDLNVKSELKEAACFSKNLLNL